MSQIEKAVYFRIARGFAWFLLVTVTLGLIVDALLLAPLVWDMIATSTSVGPRDLTRAVASASSFSPNTNPAEANLNPAEMAKLDQAAYEIIKLLTVDSSNQQIVDSVRGRIRLSAANLSEDQKDQLAILHELRDDLSELPETQRNQAADAYFNLKSRAIEQVKLKKTAAQGGLVMFGSSLVIGIALLTLVTMILVLLAIERNSRQSLTAQAMTS